MIPTERRGRTQPDETIDVAVVCFFNPADAMAGGSERIAWAEAELLSRTRRVALFCASSPAENAPMRQVRLGGWSRALYQPPGPGQRPGRLALLHLLNLFNPIVLVEALRWFRRLRPAVVHTHNLIALSPAVWVAARLSGARVVHTHHDLWLLCERATMTDAEGRPCDESQLTCRACRGLRPVKRALLTSVSSEVFPSRWLRSRLRRSGPVVTSFSSGKPAPPRGAGRRPTILYVGALTPHKLGPLLDAFAQAATAAPGLQLVIAGRGPLEPEVREAATRADVDYLGQVDPAERDRLLGEATLLVIPSTCAENSPLVFFEALSAGLPVVASDLGGLTELARWGTAELVPPGDADALAAALVSLATDETRLAELRAAALRHGLEAAPQRFLEEIEAVLTGGDQPR